MVFGNEDEELIQLNESTLWSGGPVTNNVNPDAPNYLPQIRQAIFEGDYNKASALCKKMQGVYSESYLPLGDLTIKQELRSYRLIRDLLHLTAEGGTNYAGGGGTYPNLFD